jgi:hypothetical protein
LLNHSCHCDLLKLCSRKKYENSFE